MKELKIAIFEKSGKLPRGIYVFKESNIWYPIVYFRKSKFATKKEFDTIIKCLKH